MILNLIDLKTDIYRTVRFVLLIWTQLLLSKTKISIFLGHHLNEGRDQYAHEFYLVFGFRRHLRDLKIRLESVKKISWYEKSQIGTCEALVK